MTLAARRASPSVTVAASPLLLDSISPFAAFSVRKLRTAYAGSALRVQRASDSTEQDIGFTAGGLDTAALATFCSGTTGYVSKWYDQTGNGRDLTQSTQSHMWRIYASGAVDTKNSKPTLYAPDDARGMASASFTANATTLAVGAAVASFPSTSTAVPGTSPRFISVVGASATDNASADGVALISRSGSQPAVQQWRLLRNSGLLVQTAIYDQLQQVYAAESGGSCALAVDGSQATASLTGGTIAATSFLLGMTNLATYGSVTGACISEYLISFASIDQTAIRTSQTAYFATA